MNNKTLKKIATPIFILITAILWITVTFIYGNKFIAYSCVLTCFLFSLLFFKSEKLVLVQVVALLFTCGADVFLILLEGELKTLAMVIFLCAQVCYAIKTLLFANSKRERLIQIILRVSLSIVGGTAVLVVLKAQAQALFVISVIYYVNLILSAVFSFIHFNEGTNQKLTAIGLTLFALCDVTIGFDFLIDIFSLSSKSFLYKLTHLPFSLVHLFYYPSQTLLSLSVLTKSK